jgi:hypothetical protein
MTSIPLEAMSDNGQIESEDDSIEEFELGSDLTEDSSEEDVPSVTRSPEKTNGSTQESKPQDQAIDLDTLDPATLTSDQDLAKNLTADYHRKTQAVADERRVNAEQAQRLQALEQRLNERVDRLAVGEPKSEDPFTELRQQLDQDEVKAVDIIDQIDTIRNGEFRDQTNQKINQLTNAMQRILLHTVNQMGQQAEVKAVSLREKYADFDTTQAQRDALRKVANPATQKPYTDEEAHRMVTGLSSEESQQLQQQDKQARRQPTPLKPTNRPTTDSGGAFSENELTSAMQDLGFG